MGSCSSHDIIKIGIDHPTISTEKLVEHYHPPEFPIEPIIDSYSQQLIKESWNKIINKNYNSDDALFGSVSGTTYFYNVFYDQLFIRYQEFENIFSNINSRASILGKVISLCVSINIENLDVTKKKLKYLGHIHQKIVHHPFLFAIYATTLHTTIKTCLGEDASLQIMNAWLHTIAWVLREMLPTYFEMYKNNFNGVHIGATNASSIVKEKHKQEVKDISKQKAIKSREKIS